jgi:hypothetical protein
MALSIGCVSIALAQGSATASVTVSGLGNPPQKGKVHTDATWSNCTGADNVKVILIKVTNQNPRMEAILPNARTLQNIGGTGTMGNDWDGKDGIAQGDTVYAKVEVFDNAGKTLASNKSLDTIVP